MNHVERLLVTCIRSGTGCRNGSPHDRAIPFGDDDLTHVGYIVSVENGCPYQKLRPR